MEKEVTWKTVAATAGFGFIGAMAWAATRLHPMTFEDADQKAERLIDDELDNTKTTAKKKNLPQYVLAMLGRLRSSVASEIWEAYDRGKMLGKQEGRMELIPEIQEFLAGQAEMAEERARGNYNKTEWLAVAREFRAAAGVMNGRHLKG